MTSSTPHGPSPDPDFDPSEVMASQAPALQLLLAMGWQYLSPAKARQLRGPRLLNVVLDDVLRDALKRFNRIHTTTGEHLFSEENLSTAIQRLKSVPYNGLLRTNEAVYDLLTLGTTLEQTIDGDSRGCLLMACHGQSSNARLLMWRWGRRWRSWWVTRAKARHPTCLCWRRCCWR
jgi:hypothetical protein